MTNPSRASSYSSPTTARRAVRGTAHRVPSCIGDVTKSSRSPRAGGKAPPRVTSVREGALRRPRRPQKDRILVAVPCATPPSIKTLPDQKEHAEGASCPRTDWLGPLGPFPPSFLASPASLKTPLVGNKHLPPTLGIFGIFL